MNSRNVANVYLHKSKITKSHQLKKKKVFILLETFPVELRVKWKLVAHINQLVYLRYKNNGAASDNLVNIFSRNIISANALVQIAKPS